LERTELVEPINELYRQAWGPLMNFFLPGLKLECKWRQGSRWRKRYELAQTAYQRLMASEKLSNKERVRLRDRFESLDPFVLKADVEKRLKKILAVADVAALLWGKSSELWCLCHKFFQLDFKSERFLFGDRRNLPPSNLLSAHVVLSHSAS
jgi:hypothetical protein